MKKKEREEMHFLIFHRENFSQFLPSPLFHGHMPSLLIVFPGGSHARVTLLMVSLILALLFLYFIFPIKKVDFS
jgi:hypothetical protein